MVRPHIAVLALMLAAPAAAQTGGDAAPHEQAVEISLSNFAFAPRDIRLRAGQPYRLHLVNSANGGHNFSAPAFFRTARIAPADAAAVRNGTIEVPKGQARDIRLVPARGTYPVKCTHFLHSGFGMKGSITAE